VSSQEKDTQNMNQVITPPLFITREWAMPNAWTFSIKPIAQLLREEMDTAKEIWLDPFAGNHSPAQLRNDLREDTNAQDHEDALKWLKKQKNADGVLLDPPYSMRQVSEHYKEAGIKITGWHTSTGWGATIKNEVARILKPGGKVICFGWNSMGLGKNRGFKMTRILLVPHGGSKNDTIVTVETKE
jgi:hypothetical protein